MLIHYLIILMARVTSVRNPERSGTRILISVRLVSATSCRALTQPLQKNPLHRCTGNFNP